MQHVRSKFRALQTMCCLDPKDPNIGMLADTGAKSGYALLSASSVLLVKLRSHPERIG